MDHAFTVPPAATLHPGKSLALAQPFYYLNYGDFTFAADRCRYTAASYPTLGRRLAGQFRSPNQDGNPRIDFVGNRNELPDTQVAPQVDGKGNDVRLLFFNPGDVSPYLGVLTVVVAQPAAIKIQDCDLNVAGFRYGCYLGCKAIIS